ncbi:hypothetical protein ACFY9N_00060 [Microbacterium sp. NPDC008134]|uniref:hypothetical protein n=1 Tax=Microbacterium sp. NPDC008134 TaxID=3364183 RepID=UPI0036E3AAB6
MGNTRVRARLRRTLSTLALAAALVAGPVLAAPAEPAAAASAITVVDAERALSGETPSPRTEVTDTTVLTPVHLAIGGVSVALLLAVVWGLVLDVRRRLPHRKSRMPGI